MSSGLQIFRFRVVLKPSRAVRLHPHQAGLVYAVMAEANGLAQGIPPAVPEGLMVEAVEQCRIRVAPFQHYAFGLTLLAGSPTEARERCRLLRRGLNALGQKPTSGSLVFCGNFSLVEIYDLVADRSLFEDNLPTAIAIEDILAEIDRLRAHPRLTIRFTSPLRMSRTKHGLAGRKPLFFDRREFQPEVFLRRVRGRVAKLGLLPLLNSDAVGRVELVANHLVWLDIPYGFGPKQKQLGGAAGDVILTGLTRDDIETLVWGQYTGIGESTRFGHGRYRIAQLGIDPYACPRSTGLRDLAFNSEFLDVAAERYDLESGRAGHLVRLLRSGHYAPQPATTVTIGQGTKQRQLAIPHREDRVLQRAVLELIGDALDPLFQSSSLAYRRGKGRHDAPPQLQAAFAQGYRWAVRADFSDFFDSIEHDELQRRLHAYLADPQLVGLLMVWVGSASPKPGRGLPTGAVISPLLANVFLDEFDEQVAHAGGRLIRYADDFVILFREQAAAEAMFNTAEELAEELRLALNAQKSSVIDLREPFQFLGFEFKVGAEWSKSSSAAPQSIDHLGWRETNASSRLPEGGLALPGETHGQSVAPRGVVLIGPGWDWITARGDTLRYGRRDRETMEVPLDFEHVDLIVALGYPDLEQPLLRRLRDTGTSVVVASDAIADDLWLTRADLEDAELVRAQVRCVDDPAWRLEVATWLIVVKLMNYAALSKAAPSRHGTDSTIEQLQELAHRAGRCERVEQLLGLEGAGAAAWYRSLNGRVSPAFAFPGRQAPAADDPINVLLNIGYTALHRWLIILLRQQGFAPSVGILHTPRRGHAALASDLQEPFRHLVDRVVIEFSYEMSPSDFQQSQHGPFALKIAPGTQKRFRAALYRSWNRYCRGLIDSAPQPYLQIMNLHARALRRHLLDRSSAFVPFEHPSSEESGT
ncbi:MAG: CRISPR-associated endonuclease Cas1 [Planctomycetota bacterium]